ncbi:hypothetical protein SLE2022_120520 [Rubroshorea leprosula]|uniref:Uncharacterized protein n=1 Tax=Rubroshorea leprosula TaxID=152421 RepID=A0AAV5IJ56_9ROSI|nr:hypothetical protein SLEP1_g10943 [Rubroshorea leprosula]
MEREYPAIDCIKPTSADKLNDLLFDRTCLMAAVVPCHQPLLLGLVAVQYGKLSSLEAYFLHCVGHVYFRMKFSFEEHVFFYGQNLTLPS